MAFTRKGRRLGGATRRSPLDLCERLLDDPEDLVRKGVGWALKDLMRGDKTRVLAYVADLRRRGASAVITLYALRDLQGAERQAVLGIHRGNR